jgi:putative hydrolase of the HAD superfamily
MKNYKHLFFDLDKTLWDFTENSKDTFLDLFAIFKLKEKGIPSVEIFHDNYNKHNDLLWDQYRKGLVEKSFLIVQRYILTLADFNIHEENLAENMSKEYIRISPLKTKLIPHTHEVLEYLSKKYLLHIITNGFSEVQYIKIEKSGLKKYFDKIITSEEAGYAKPNKEIFLYSLNKASAIVNESLMIGDDIEVDILGAQSIGMNQVFLNLENIICSVPVTHEIISLKELMKIL